MAWVVTLPPSTMPRLSPGCENTLAPIRTAAVLPVPPNGSLATTMADPEVRAQLEKIGGMIPAPMSPAEATKEYEAQTARFRAVARAIKLQAQ